MKKENNYQFWHKAVRNDYKSRKIIIYHLIDRVENQVWGQVENHIFWKIRDQIRDQFRVQVYNQLKREISDEKRKYKK